MPSPEDPVPAHFCPFSPTRRPSPPAQKLCTKLCSSYAPVVPLENWRRAAPCASLILFHPPVLGVDPLFTSFDASKAAVYCDPPPPLPCRDQRDENDKKARTKRKHELARKSLENTANRIGPPSGARPAHVHTRVLTQASSQSVHRTSWPKNLTHDGGPRRTCAKKGSTNVITICRSSNMNGTN